MLCALFPTVHIQHCTLWPLTQWVLLDNEMLDSSTLIKGLMNNMISLAAATEELVWGNRDCVLGNVVHEIGTSVLISKLSQGWCRNIDLERKLGLRRISRCLREVDRAGIISQQLAFWSHMASHLSRTLMARNSTRIFLHCQVVKCYSLLPKSAIQTLPAALFCFVKHDTKLHFLPRRGFSFAAAPLGLLTPSWHPFPPRLLYLSG